MRVKDQAQLLAEALFLAAENKKRFKKSFRRKKDV